MLSEYAVEGRWPDMFRDMRRTQRQLNRLLGDLRSAATAEFPPVNVWVGAQGALLAAEIPGVASEQIDITVQQSTITLQGKREPEVVDGEAIVHRQERMSGSFSRTVVLPFRVDAERVSAQFQRGVLTLELPRPAADQPRQIKLSRS
jgi:HSP20 family protein